MSEAPTTDKRKTKVVAIIAAVITVATPGVYSAWQSAKTAWAQRLEQKTRDSQEGDVAKNVKALQAQIKAIEKTCVSHKDLIDILLKMNKSGMGVGGVSVKKSIAKPLSDQIGILEGKAVKALKAQTKAVKAVKAAPKIRSSDQVRQQIIKVMMK